MTTNRILLPFFIFTAALFVILAAYALDLRFQPVRVLEPRVARYHVLTPTVAAGQPVLYAADYCKYLPVNAKVVRQLHGPALVSLPAVESALPVGCRQALVATTIVPPTTPPGTYTMTISLTYPVNPLRTEVVNIETEPFTVTAPTPTP